MQRGALVGPRPSIADRVCPGSFIGAGGRWMGNHWLRIDDCTAPSEPTTAEDLVPTTERNEIVCSRSLRRRRAVTKSEPVIADPRATPPKKRSRPVLMAHSSPQRP